MAIYRINNKSPRYFLYKHQVRFRLNILFFDKNVRIARMYLLYNAVMRTKFNLKNVIPYVIYAAATLCLNNCSAKIPLSLALYFAALICGTNVIATPIIFVACSLYPFNLTVFLLSVFESAFLCGVVLIYRRIKKNMKIEGCAYLVLSLVPYVIAAPQPITDFYIFNNPYAVKALAVLTATAFFCFALSSVNSLLYKICRCSLKRFEILSLSVLSIAVGTGLFSFIGEYAYYCVICCIATTAIRIFQSPSACVCSFVLSLPACIALRSFAPPTVCLIITLITLLFCNAGKFAPSVIAFIGTVIACKIFNFYSTAPLIVILRILLLLCACLLPSVASNESLVKIKNALLFKGFIDNVSLDTYKGTVSERLFRISDVFREIENAFLGMDEEIDDNKIRLDMLSDLKTRCCKNCPNANKCAQTDVYRGFKRIIENGCVKGRVTLIDLPKEITVNCKNAQDVIANLNKLLAEYKRFLTEIENAKSGRILLATQANGVAQVMKNCAVQAIKNAEPNIALQNKIADALSNSGIICPELKLFENDVYLTVYGNVDHSNISNLLFNCTGNEYILKDKINFNLQLNCYIFTPPPKFDATFGIATAVKEGEKSSGDTHSVIKITEHSFLSVLSDGMGSGEYAKRVSSTAISLIEAFYKAQMPENTVIDTINKLITFNRDERFACIDMAAINLDTGRANLIKIGSPVAIILSGAECRVLESTGIPLGILDSLKPTVSTCLLKDGDVIIFMSDGITSAFNSTPELCDFLRSTPKLNPQNLADCILNEAKSRENGVISDDMTVLCTRIFEK